MDVSWWAVYSDEELARVAAGTDAYLDRFPDVHAAISESTWLIQGLTQLVPVTEKSLFSGNLHPLFEAEADLRASTTQMRLGLYKQALTGLRGVLELGLLSVYWDVDDAAHTDIRDWLRGSVDTPGSKTVGKRLSKLASVKTALEEDTDLFERGAVLSREISAFVHSRGFAHSTAGLIPHTNRPAFDESVLLKWASLLERVLELVLTFHLLKYPVGLQVTPLSQKLGLNKPVGGFVEPFVRDRFLAHLHPARAKLLQGISDADPQARKAAEYFQSLPDYPPEAWRDDMIKDDQRWIAMMGYEGWRRTYDARPVLTDESSDDKRVRADYGDRLKTWAIAEGLPMTEADLTR